MKDTDCGAFEEKLAAAERRDAALAFLSQIIRLHDRIDLLEVKIETRRDGLGLHSPVLSDMPKNPSPSASVMEDKILKIIALEEEAEALRKKKPVLKAEMMEYIGKVEDDMVQLALIGLYLNRKSPDEVGKGMNYSGSYVRKLRTQGIRRMTDILDEEGVLQKWIEKQRHWI